MRRLARLARLVDAYANAALVFLLLVAALSVALLLVAMLLGLWSLASSLLYIALIFGVPPFCVLVGRSIDPEGNQ